MVTVGVRIQAAIVVVAAIAAFLVVRRAKPRFGTGRLTQVEVPSATGCVIEVARADAGRRDALRAYRVQIDGRTAGEVWPGGAVEVPVPPGEHTVRIRLDWTGSDSLTVECVSGHRVRLACEPSRPGFAIADLVGSITGGKPWVSLTPVDPDTPER